jgi:hypothetical protein
MTCRHCLANDLPYLGLKDRAWLSPVPKCLKMIFFLARQLRIFRIALALVVLTGLLKAMPAVFKKRIQRSSLVVPSALQNWYQDTCFLKVRTISRPLQ